MPMYAIISIFHSEFIVYYLLCVAPLQAFLIAQLGLARHRNYEVATYRESVLG